MFKYFVGVSMDCYQSSRIDTNYQNTHVCVYVYLCMHIEKQTTSIEVVGLVVSAMKSQLFGKISSSRHFKRKFLPFYFNVCGLPIKSAQFSNSGGVLSAL